MTWKYGDIFSSSIFSSSGVITLTDKHADKCWTEAGLYTELDDLHVSQLTVSKRELIAQTNALKINIVLYNFIPYYKSATGISETKNSWQHINSENLSLTLQHLLPLSVCTTVTTPGWHRRTIRRIGEYSQRWHHRDLGHGLRRRQGRPSMRLARDELRPPSNKWCQISAVNGDCSVYVSSYLTTGLRQTRMKSLGYLAAHFLGVGPSKTQIKIIILLDMVLNTPPTDTIVL